jgi:hypothetical protein
MEAKTSPNCGELQGAGGGRRVARGGRYAGNVSGPSRTVVPIFYPAHPALLDPCGPRHDHERTFVPPDPRKAPSHDHGRPGQPGGRPPTNCRRRNIR